VKDFDSCGLTLAYAKVSVMLTLTLT
jgi:hypothetical protein